MSGRSSATAAIGSSSTWSPTSTSSSTSDRPHPGEGSGPLRRVNGFVRLGHPFPSILNSAATFAFTMLAGAALEVGGRLALSMLLVQVSIGALNDWADATRDAEGKPGKPIPAGLARRGHALMLAVAAGPLGLLLSAPSGVPAVAVLGAGLALGYVYNLGLSRTPWSWLPLALALPVVPMHAWLGVTGSLPPGIGSLYPVTVLAGAVLSLGNGLVDLERDGRAGRRTIAVALGPGRAWVVHAMLVVGLIAAATALVPAVPAPAPPPPGGPLPGMPAVGASVAGAIRLWCFPIGIVMLAAGALVLGARSPRVRERGWELEAVGVGAVGVAWLAGVASVAPA